MAAVEVVVMKLEIQADKPLFDRAAGSTRYLSLAIEAPEAPRQRERPPVSVALTLDRSGSMDGEKLERAKAAVLHAVRTLASTDQFCVVIYDNNVEVLVPSGPATPERRRLAEQRLASVRAGNTTALFDGWRTGCEELAKQLPRDALGRCLLLTDGLANVGLTDREPIAAHVAEQRRRGISTTTLGLGADFDEALLQQMSTAGGGNFYFIESAAQIRDFIASEIGEALDVVVPGAVLTVRASANVEVRSLNDYPITRHGESWRVELGSLVSAQLLDPILAIVCPAGQGERAIELLVALEDRDGTIIAPARSVTLQPADAAAVAECPANPEIARQVARLLAAKASQDSLELNHAGRYDEARQLLEPLAKQIREQANGDAVQLEIAAELEDKANLYAQPMDPVSRKLRHFQEYRGLKSKLAGGQSRRADAQAPIDMKAIVNSRAAEDILVLPATPELAAVARLTVSSFNRRVTNMPFSFAISDALVSSCVAAERSEGMLAHEDESELVALATRASAAAKLRVVLTGRGLADHWFAHSHPLAAAAVVSVHNWSQLSTAPLEAFVAYELILQGLAVLAPGYRARDLLHEDTRGCLWDFGRDRTRIGDKLRGAGICEDCRGALHRLGIAEQPVRELIAVMRSLATGAPSPSPR
jgi:Ca-activated chloride channel family protein